MEDVVLRTYVQSEVYYFLFFIFLLSPELKYEPVRTDTLLWNGEVTGFSILASVTWAISHNRLTLNKGIEMAISSPMKEEQSPIESFTAYQI
ncbi:hypothetical protein TRV_07773 [Trichophyton verrucosum HKI 0517]|uniref:Uncharacterized protein n=1 Tax=Trichophyton verrucosum (strain HKI 0517) TaxID=663202 RepID=D4DKP9_TRIVH|nr:uncharacterized protein TRV_07773 [Trichophyton verrucosum HKI 0517]EFE37553.1 hypothetical protein TRV_07773 [Trichophyton verrucosum HKI 0517]